MAVLQLLLQLQHAAAIRVDFACGGEAEVIVGEGGGCNGGHSAGKFASCVGAVLGTIQVEGEGGGLVQDTGDGGKRERASGGGSENGGGERGGGGGAEGDGRRTGRDLVCLTMTQALISEQMGG